MCTEIIPTNITNDELESVVISFRQPAHHSGTKDCGMEEDCIRRLDTTLLVKRHCIKLRQSLTSKLLRVKQDSPRIKCLRLIDSVDESVLPKPYFITINTCDLLSGMTSSQPLYLLSSSPLTDRYALRSLQDGEYEDSCGKFEELEEAIEGFPWVETAAGNRLAMKNAPSHTRKHFNLKATTLEERGVYQAKRVTGCELWNVESRAGRTLLFAGEVEGFPDIELLERELLEDEGSDRSDSDEADYEQEDSFKDGSDRRDRNSANPRPL